jgi:hypothetical protein
VGGGFSQESQNLPKCLFCTLFGLNALGALLGTPVKVPAKVQGAMLAKAKKTENALFSVKGKNTKLVKHNMSFGTRHAD